MFALMAFFALVFISLCLPFIGFTSIDDSKKTELLRKELKNNFTTWVAFNCTVTIFAIALFSYGASNESTWGIAFLTALATPFAFIGGILYPFWYTCLANDVK